MLSMRWVVVLWKTGVLSRGCIDDCVGMVEGWGGVRTSAQDVLLQ
jgi:hypothetical protein